VKATLSASQETRRLPRSPADFTALVSGSHPNRELPPLLTLRLTSLESPAAMRHFPRLGYLTEVNGLQHRILSSRTS
jgi:hypothetical protein